VGIFILTLGREHYRYEKFLLASTLLVLGACRLSAQTTMREKMLKDLKEFSDRTLFQRFEQEMVPTAEQRKKTGSFDHHIELK